jgi:hypothetical protein
MDQNDSQNLVNKLLIELCSIREEAIQKKAKFLEKYQQLEQQVQKTEKQTVSSATPYTAISEPKGLKAIKSPQRPKPRLPDLLYFEGNKAE